MGIAGQAAREAGGQVIGVIPRRLLEAGIAFEDADELIMTEDMRQRKAEMDRLGDGFLVLPGGVGTLEEALEVVTLRQLGFHNKPVVFLNHNGWFDPLRAMLRHMVEARFAKETLMEALRFAETRDQALDLLEAWRPEPLERKWFPEDAEIS